MDTELLDPEKGYETKRGVVPDFIKGFRGKVEYRYSGDDRWHVVDATAFNSYNCGPHHVSHIRPRKGL